MGKRGNGEKGKRGKGEKRKGGKGKIIDVRTREKRKFGEIREEKMGEKEKKDDNNEKR